MAGTTQHSRSRSSYFTPWIKLTTTETAVNKMPYIPLSANEAGNASNIVVMTLPKTFADQEVIEDTSTSTSTVKLYAIHKVDNKTVYAEVATASVDTGVPYTFKDLRACDYVAKITSGTDDLYISYENNPIPGSQPNMVQQTSPVKYWTSMEAGSSPMQNPFEVDKLYPIDAAGK